MDPTEYGTKIFETPDNKWWQLKYEPWGEARITPLGLSLYKYPVDVSLSKTVVEPPKIIPSLTGELHRKIRF
jgi:hypothetical protein